MSQILANISTQSTKLSHPEEYIIYLNDKTYKIVSPRTVSYDLMHATWTEYLKYLELRGLGPTPGQDITATIHPHQLEIKRQGAPGKPETINSKEIVRSCQAISSGNEVDVEEATKALTTYNNNAALPEINLSDTCPPPVIEHSNGSCFVAVPTVHFLNDPLARKKLPKVIEKIYIELDKLKTAGTSNANLQKNFDALTILHKHLEACGMPEKMELIKMRSTNSEQTYMQFYLT